MKELNIYGSCAVSTCFVMLKSYGINKAVGCLMSRSVRTPLEAIHVAYIIPLIIDTLILLPK